MSPRGERRRHRRQPSTARAIGQKGLLAYVRDFTEHGARLSVVSPHPVRPGRVLRLRFRPSLGRDLDMVARCAVVWSRAMGPYRDIGVRFAPLASDDRQRLRSLSREVETARSGGQPPPRVRVTVLEGGRPGEG